MVSQERDPRTRVTYHAVTLYVQRIMGVMIDIDPHQTPAQECAAAHCDAAGTTIAEVRALICTRGIKLAVILGFENVTSGAFSVKISPGGVITTVLKAPTRNQKRLVVMSDRERNQSSKRMRRKLKRRPSQALTSLSRTENEEEQS